MFWGYAARQCIIDNTNLARLRGSGRQAVIVPEMVSFAQRYGFQFVCHAICSCKSQGGRGAKFLDRRDQLPAGPQLRESGRPQPAGVRVGHGADGPPPAEQDAADSRQGLRARTPLPEPTAAAAARALLAHERGTDQYGYVAFQGNYYWIPGDKREDVKVLEYADRLKIYQRRTCVAEYPLPADGVKNARFSPEGQPRLGTCPSTASTAPRKKSSGSAPWGRKSRPTSTTR